MKLGFFGWFTMLLVLHAAVALWCKYEYEMEWTWAIVAIALAVGHLFATAMTCVVLYPLIVAFASAEAVDVASKRKP